MFCPLPPNNQSPSRASTPHPNAGRTEPLVSESGLPSEVINTVSVEAANATEMVMTPLRRYIQETTKTTNSGELWIVRVSNWQESASSDGTLPWNIEEDPEFSVESQRPETSAESQLRDKLAILQSLANDEDCSDFETESEMSDKEDFDRTGPGPFMFSPGRPEFRDLLFFRTLHQCRPFVADEGVTRAFLRCAHHLTNSDVTKSFFTGFPIYRREKILYARYRVLKGWITQPGQWKTMDHGSPQEEAELHKLILDMLPEEVVYLSREKPRRDEFDYSDPSDSSYGSESSLGTTSVTTSTCWV
ncbi:hypothetical protein CROQUDRAFT_672106 [Cronartium quercuum f. sp. fusiforme G11]|uniref:Uncharacterized protein n=1 Tax=Cronartium quercuum f. sp. fusiforme G11 TaxID=708437 RepID=A0A9P6NJV2_9BASI|nr:hypothetical protein CROQUDRAFT_672106 [Cronartium quercuum f. sp. fusiforme G11]